MKTNNATMAVQAPMAPNAPTTARRRGLWADVWLRLKRNKSAVAGMVMLAVILVVVYGAPLFISYEEDVIRPDLFNALQFPAEGRLLGTDEIGRDVFARIIWGGRISIGIGFASMLMSFVIGSAIGAIAGYYGGRTDSLLMRFLDVFMAIPTILLMITLVSIMPPTLLNLTFALAISSVPAAARLIRGQVLQIAGQEYIEAIRGQGASDFRIIVMHILPNAISPLISQFVMNVAGGIMQISALSFIGLGVQAPNPEWGAMLASGRNVIRDAWHVTAFPGIAIVITIIALTLMGDGLRDALDPRMKR